MNAGTGPITRHPAGTATLLFLGGISECQVMCTDPGPSFPNQAAGRGQKHTFNPLGGNDFKEVICALLAGTADGDLKPDGWASKCFALKEGSPGGGGGGVEVL